jgi:Tol biopolymer transport system component
MKTPPTSPELAMTPRILVGAAILLVACDAQSRDERVAFPPPLSAMAAAETPPPQGTGASRVWIPRQYDEVYDVSPDGRYLALIDWSTGNLVLQDLDSDARHDLTKKGSYTDTDDEAENAAYSTDGRRIAYEWWDSKGKNDELRVMNSDGSGIRTVYRSPGVTLWPTDWTPDDKHILAILGTARCNPLPCVIDSTRRLALVPSDSGEPRILKTFYERNTHALVSPDGRYVVYTSGERKDDMRRDIRLIPLDGTRESVVVQHSADDYPVGWSADGSRLIIASDRGGSPGLWSIRIANARVVGTPQLVRGDLWRMRPIGLDREGKLYYHVTSGDRDVYVAPIDAETGRLQSPPVSLTRNPGEAYSMPVWSPDGKHIAYFVREASGVRHVFVEIRSVGGDEVRRFLPRVFSPASITWIPGSQALAVVGNDRNDRNSKPLLARLDLQTGQTEILLAGAYALPAFSRDGKTMYYAPRPNFTDSSSRLLARDLATGRERLIYTHKGGGRINANSVSPDGRWVILVWNAMRGRETGSWAHGNFAVSTTTGEVRNLGATIPFDSARTSQRQGGFTPDGKSAILFVRRTDSTEIFSFWKVPLDGSPAVRLKSAPDEMRVAGGRTGPALGGAWFSPDGRRITFVHGTQRTEIWQLDEPSLRSGSGTR